MTNIEDLRGRSVSWGTLKSDDLIPKFLGVLKTYGKDKYDKYIKENPEVEDWENLDEETMGWVVDELTDLLNEIAPDGCYFGASDSDGADFGFWSMSNESKKSEDASVHELEFVDIDEIYSASDFDDLVYKVVFSGQLDVDTDKVEQGVLPNDIILTARGYNTATFDFEVDKIVKQLAGTGIVLKVDDVIKNEATYAKKSEAYEDIWRGADVMTFDEACEQLDLPADRLQDFIDEYGENWDEDPDAMNEYVQRVDDFVFSCFDQDFVSIDGEEIPLGLCREPKVLIVQDIDHKGGDKAVELVKKLANGELTGSSDDGDYVAIMDGVNGSPHFDIYSEGGKSEGNDDDKGCKGKDCKDDKTKKNEADATFKVGDFVTYDAASDGKEDFINEYVSAEIADINDDGSLVLWIYDLDDGGNDVKDADPQFCTKLDHYAGKVDADHYYMDGPYKAYKGGWEILITKKDLNPRVYEFIGTIDELGDVMELDDYYGGENFSYDIDLKDTLESSTPFDVNGLTFADMTGDVGESKQTEAKKKYYGYGKDDAIDKEDNDFMWQVAYEWFEDRLPEKLKGKADSAVYKVIDKDSRAYEEIVTMDDYHAYLQKYGPSVIKDIKANDESKQTEGLPPKKLGNRLYRSRADLINKMKTLDAVEITTPAQFNDIHSKQWLHTAGYAMDINGNLVGQTYFGDKDGKWYYATTKTFQGDYLPECKESKKSKSRFGKMVEGNAADYDGKYYVDIEDEDEDTLYSSDMEFDSSRKASLWAFDELEKCKDNDDVFQASVYQLFINDDGDLDHELVEVIHKSDLEESKKSEGTKVGKFTIMPKDTSKKQAGIEDYQNRLSRMGFTPNLHHNGDYIHDYVKEIGKIPGATVYVGTIDNFQQKTQEYQYEAELYMENEKGIRSNIEYMPFAITDISDGTQRKMYFNRLNALIKKGTDFVNNHESSESCKKSESLTLKQKELKDMARFGQAEDITTISDEEAKALRKKGIETIGVSRGTYGMNGALLRDNEGKKYVITARSSNLFYFV